MADLFVGKPYWCHDVNGRMLAKMAKRDLISIDGRKWYITPKELSLF